MQIISTRLRGVRRLGRAIEISAGALRRLKWMDYYESCGRNARKTCRHFDISAQTFYRWRGRYSPSDLKSLEQRSRRPRRLRRGTWSAELAEAVRSLRQRYPRWGKDKLVVLLRQQGWTISTSMVGRILRELKAKGQLVEPLPKAISARKARRPRPYAVRKPKDYVPSQPGDLVQLDTLDVRPLPGVVLKHFTARDIVSRWDVIEVHRKATAKTTAGFLDALQVRMPFPIRALQVDGGSEFQAAFEAECERRRIRLFVLPPRSPKLNGHVERANRTHTEEFYEIWPFSAFSVDVLNREAQAWEKIYNTIRPHQSLGYKTPLQFLESLPGNGGEANASRP